MAAATLRDWENFFDDGGVSRTPDWPVMAPGNFNQTLTDALSDVQENGQAALVDVVSQNR